MAAEDVEVPAPTGEASDPAPAWSPTRALGRAVLLTGLLLVVAVAVGRVDLVVLAIPFAVGAAVALRRRPGQPPSLRVEADDAFVVEGGPVAGALVVGNPDAAGYDLVVVRARFSPWLRLERADRPFVLSVPAGDEGRVELAGTALRWGRHDLGPVAARAAACGGLLACRPVVVDPLGVRAYPVTEPFEADEAMPRAAGLVGAHRSRRFGEGGELAGVRVFGPGDRLRRVDWRVSLRARELHVAATLSDRDAEVVLVLDLLTEAGRSGGLGGAPSVLDTTVRATAAIAEHYLNRGDRVSLLEYRSDPRRLRAAAGRRQYLTALEWLLDAVAEPSAEDPYDMVFGPHPLASEALVVVLTPLVDPRSARMLARLARSGRFVVAVDTLSPELRPAPQSRRTDLAYRLWRLDRENTVGQLREHGVPVVRWAGAGSLDLVLRDVARLASAPRPMGRR